MNEYELINEIIKCLKDENYQFSEETLNELVKKGIIINTDDFDYEVSHKVYEALDKIKNKKEIIFSALNDFNNELRITLATIILNQNPTAIYSVKEIEKFLTNENVKGEQIDSGLIVKLIQTTGNVEKYLTSEILQRFGLTSPYVVSLIKTTGNIEKYLTGEKIKEFGLDGYHIVELIKATGNVEKYLTGEKVKEFGLEGIWTRSLIEATRNIEKYLTVEEIKEFGFDSYNVVELIKAAGNIEKYLTVEKIKEFELDSSSVINLIKTTGNIEKYLTTEIIKAAELNSNDVKELIKETGNIEKYLTGEKIKEFGLDSSSVENLIKETGNIERYLIPETIKKFELNRFSVIELIKATGNIGKYLTKEIIQSAGISDFEVIGLIRLTGNIEKNLTPEIIKVANLKSSDVKELIKETGNIEKYLTGEKIKEFGLNSSSVENLIKETGNIEKYLTLEIIKESKMNGENISRLLLGTYEYGFAQIINEDLKNGNFNRNKLIKLKEIINNFQNSNSGRLSRISTEIALQIYELPQNEQQNAIENVKNIYLTTNIPTFAQNFLVFKQLHPEFLNNSSNALYKDRSKGNIPSLSVATPRERNHIIFSDLLRISIESNNRNLREYLSLIEQGDKLFNLFKEGKLQLDDKLPEGRREILKKYSDMLNSLYNQTSKRKSLGNLRVNSGNLTQALEELDKLFSEDTKLQSSLPDRIVRMFGYWAGISNFEQAKRLIEEVPKQTDRKNREFAQKGDFNLQKGDFVKGIANTVYFPQMLQNGIVAKDYLGQNSTSDCTPLDMDVELIKEDGKIKTATSYTNGDINGRNLGKIIIVIKKDGKFIKTREGQDINQESVKEVMQDKTKKEYFDNNGTGGENAHGIRTGIGSTNISYIIADRYVDKLGLEIAINGFYIPIVDEKGKLLFTPQIYDDLRSKMQGMSYYGVTEFKLDETAKNEGTKQIIELIEKNKEEVSQKRQKILQTLKEAIENCGLEMSDKRILDLKQGIVEVVDTGSTGRGTNEPGDGDFDFMIRLDNKILSNPEQIKEELKKALSNISEPTEGNVTGNGDFRYKGVSIQGLEDKVDLDLTFTRRTDEIEYTTEESIKDRLETIKRNNPEDYKYVVANILLAKKVLKTEGAYKKKNAPEPEQGKKDIRGGLGAVGIENWVLQNGGSFEKAAREFLEVAKTCSNLSEFQEKYAVWDFGENYMAGDRYPHDNFVYNMNEDGYEKMKKALEDYIKAISMEKDKSQESYKKGLGEIVQEDMTVLNDTTYMKTVESLLAKARGQEVAR